MYAQNFYQNQKVLACKNYVSRSASKYTDLDLIRDRDKSI